MTAAYTNKCAELRKAVEQLRISQRKHHQSECQFRDRLEGLDTTARRASKLREEAVQRLSSVRLDLEATQAANGALRKQLEQRQAQLDQATSDYSSTSKRSLCAPACRWCEHHSCHHAAYARPIARRRPCFYQFNRLWGGGQWGCKQHSTTVMTWPIRVHLTSAPLLLFVEQPRRSNCGSVARNW